MADSSSAAAIGRRSGLGARLSPLLPQGLRDRLQALTGGGAAYLGNAGMAFLIRLVGAALGFALQVVLARVLSLTDYGLYVTYWTWLFVAGQIAALGFNDSCLRFLPRYVARRRFADARAYLATGYRVVVIGSSAIAVVGLATIALLAVPWSPTVADGSRWLLLAIVFVGIPILAFEMYLEGLARSLGGFALAAAPAFVLRPIALVLAVIAASVAGIHMDAATALGMAIAVTALMTIGQAAALRRLLRRQIGPPEAAPVPVGRKQQWLWLVATLPLVVVYGVEEIYLVSDVLLLGLLANPAETGIYFAAVRIMMLAGYVYFAFTLISVREFSLARANRDHADLQRRVRRATRWTFWLTVPAVLGTVAAGYPLLAMFGPEYTAGYGVLAVLGLGMIAKASVGPGGDLLVVLGEQRSNFAVAVMSLALNVVLALALIPVLGIVGAAIGTAVSQAARAAALRTLARRRLGVDPFVLGGVPAGRPT